MAIQPPMSSGGRFVARSGPLAGSSPQTLRTGSAQIGQLSIYGPMGPYPQARHVVLMVCLDGVCAGDQQPLTHILLAGFERSNRRTYQGGVGRMPPGGGGGGAGDAPGAAVGAAPGRGT